MAVAKENSMQSVYARYENAMATGVSGRWVPEQVHDDAYKGLVESIRIIERKQYPDQIGVYKRADDADSPPEPVGIGRGAAHLLEAERNRERTPEELAARHEAWSREARSPKDPEAGIMQRIYARDPTVSEPESQRAAELAADARDKALDATIKQNKSPWANRTTSPEQRKDASELRGKKR